MYINHFQSVFYKVNIHDFADDTNILLTSKKLGTIESVTAEKMKFCIKDFFSKCAQIRSFLRIWSHLLKKSLMENFIFCAVWKSKKNFTECDSIATSVNDSAHPVSMDSKYHEINDYNKLTIDKNSTLATQIRLSLW